MNALGTDRKFREGLCIGPEKAEKFAEEEYNYIFDIFSQTHAIQGFLAIKISVQDQRVQNSAAKWTAPERIERRDVKPEKGVLFPLFLKFGWMPSRTGSIP